MQNFSERTLQIGPYINWLKLQHVPRHSIAYLEWGDPENKNVIICAHGLTRNAHDFDKIAAALSNYFRVIAISYPGRGDSDYFQDEKLYNYQVYIKESLLLLNKLQVKNPIWLGTSMGGLIGMAIASRYPKILRALILNDIGPFMPGSVLGKIGRYARQTVSFTDLQAAKKHLKMIYKAFGITEEEDWDYLVKYSFKLTSEGNYVMNYDPRIVHGMKVNPAKPKDISVWPMWRGIKCPTLVIHGAMSEILQKSTVDQMQKTKQFDLYTVEYAGHTPSLMTEDQINAIKIWLEKFC